ncbi:MAG: 16S rRNA (cytosine(967)-C(5))-methyltransferase RsmB [Ruminococcaceae bacterium]|nr:16S rRNA (cytosine(967)-C(5))-methyltransferase RsmB [Oscillospiraceae bacterium]
MNPRLLAHDLLQKAEKTEQFSNIALDKALLDAKMSDIDSALASALFYGVTEKKITLDYRLAALSSRPLDTLDKSVLCALRMGLYQLEFMDRIPAHAAINETVSLCSRKSAGFVNAILRSHTRTAATPLPSKEDDTISYLSVKYSIIPALCEKFLSVYGLEKCESIFTALDKTPPTTLRVNTLRISREALAEKIPSAELTELSAHGLKIKASVRSAYGFDDGLFFVQDEASQLCVEALEANAGETIMDICACPGSKSFGSAIRMNNQGKILSYDLHEKKLSLITSGAKRLGIDIITTAQRDGRDFLPEMEESADKVLCDVPCSGFGVLAKKPELRYKDPSVSATLPDIQLAILENACRYVKRGGRLVYSTCTVFPEENEENVHRFLDRHNNFSLTPFCAGALTVDSGMITLLPDEHGTDGFFITVMTKKGE